MATEIVVVRKWSVATAAKCAKTALDGRVVSAGVERTMPISSTVSILNVISTSKS
jgi:hypothetical protein